MLEAAGIGAGEERVYRFLVGVREANATAIAEQLGFEVAQAHRLLASLHDKGLVGRVAVSPAGGAVHYVPVAPDAALRPLLLRGHEALEAARRGVEQLTEEYRAGGRRHDRVHAACAQCRVVLGAAGARVEQAHAAAAVHRGRVVQQAAFEVDRAACPQRAGGQLRGGQLPAGVELEDAVGDFLGRGRPSP